MTAVLTESSLDTSDLPSIPSFQKMESDDFATQLFQPLSAYDHFRQLRVHILRFGIRCSLPESASQSDSGRVCKETMTELVFDQF